MGTKILVFLELRDGAVKRFSLEALSAAQRLGAEISAVAIGEGGEGAAVAAAQHGARRVYLAEDPRLKLYSSEGYSRVVADAVRKSGAEAVFFAATATGRDLAPSVAAIFETGVVSDCTGIRSEEGRLLFRRPVYAGKAFAEVAVKGTPAVASLRPNVFTVGTPETSRKPEVERLTLSASDADLKSRVREIVATAKGKVELTEAAIVVAAGRGFKGAENLPLRDKLAEVLGAAVGASRAIVDNGWCPHTEQIGQTGKTVSPTLYFAIGISGAIQHLTGMSSSKVIVAVNKDPDAPIFKKATYGIVGDLLEVLPALTEELRKAVRS